MQIIYSDSDEDGNKSKEKKQLPSVSDASKSPGQASTSKLESQNEIDHLSEMFPDKCRNDLAACLNVQGSFSKAVTTLLPENFFIFQQRHLSKIFFLTTSPFDDATKRLQIMYRGQPAADTGGVLRQFYTQLLIEVSNVFFHGEEYKSPIYNCEMVASGVMKLVGIIIVHSILQGGPGFPVFGPAVYNYLATGDVQEAMKGLTIKDCSSQMAHFITMVRV